MSLLRLERVGESRDVGDGSFIARLECGAGSLSPYALPGDGDGTPLALTPAEGDRPATPDEVKLKCRGTDDGIHRLKCFGFDGLRESLYTETLYHLTYYFGVLIGAGLQTEKALPCLLASAHLCTLYGGYLCGKRADHIGSVGESDARGVGAV